MPAVATTGRNALVLLIGWIKGGALILTYWPSEFSQIRGQYRLTDYAENIKAHEVMFQLLFSLGAHGAHTF